MQIQVKSGESVRRFTPDGFGLELVIIDFWGLGLGLMDFKLGTRFWDE